MRFPPEPVLHTAERVATALERIHAADDYVVRSLAKNRIAREDVLNDPAEAFGGLEGAIRETPGRAFRDSQDAGGRGQRYRALLHPLGRSRAKACGERSRHGLEIELGVVEQRQFHLMAHCGDVGLLEGRQFRRQALEGSQCI